MSVPTGTPLTSISSPAPILSSKSEYTTERFLYSISLMRFRSPARPVALAPTRARPRCSRDPKHGPGGKAHTPSGPLHSRNKALLNFEWVNFAHRGGRFDPTARG